MLWGSKESAHTYLRKACLQRGTRDARQPSQETPWVSSAVPGDLWTSPWAALGGSEATLTSPETIKDRQSCTRDAPRPSQEASVHAQGPLQGTLRCARVRHREPRDRSEVPGSTPGTPWRHPSMTLEHNENIEKPSVLNAFEHICEANSAARLPQSPQQRPKNVHATRGGPRRGPFAPNDIPKPS